MKRIKAVLPSLREKKRYLAFEIISKEKIKGFKPVRDAIFTSINDYLGSQGSSQTGVILLQEKYDEKMQKGILKVNHKYTEQVKASFCFIERINNNKVIVKSVGTSGTLKKAYGKYLAN